MSLPRVRFIVKNLANAETARFANEKNRYFITINTNKEEDIFADQLEDFVNIELKENNRIFETIKKHEDATLSIGESLLQVIFEYAIERGPELHRIHAHAILTIKSRDKIFFDIKKFREIAAEYFGYAPYINVVRMSTTDVVRRYVTKTVDRLRQQ